MEVIERYKDIRYRVFKWRYELEIPYKLILSFSFACITGLLAQVRIPLPWTPVPITGQTFAVLLSGVLLGKIWGGISQCIYVGLGIAGIPWFAGWKGGSVIITGPTGGYLIGFIISAFFIGYLVDRYIRTRGFFNMFLLMLFANFILIYTPGLLQLYVWLSLTKGNSPSLFELLSMGAFPFVIGDITKIAVASLLTKAITPKRAYDGEIDAGIIKEG